MLLIPPEHAGRQPEIIGQAVGVDAADIHLAIVHVNVGIKLYRLESDTGTVGDHKLRGSKPGRLAIDPDLEWVGPEFGQLAQAFPDIDQLAETALFMALHLFHGPGTHPGAHTQDIKALIDLQGIDRPDGMLLK